MITNSCTNFNVIGKVNFFQLEVKDYLNVPRIKQRTSNRNLTESWTSDWHSCFLGHWWIPLEIDRNITGIIRCYLTKLLSVKESWNLKLQTKMSISELIHRGPSVLNQTWTRLSKVNVLVEGLPRRDPYKSRCWL